MTLPGMCTLRCVLSSVDGLGQIRLGVMGSLYRLELRHQRSPADASDGSRGLNASADWLCAWLGSEHVCVNVSRRLVDWGTGEVHARLLHSSRLLNGTGKLRLSASNVAHPVAALKFFLPWCRRSRRQQREGEMAPRGRSDLRPGTTAGWRRTSENRVQRGQSRPGDPAVGVFVQAVPSSQGPAEQGNLHLHKGQNTLPGMERSFPLPPDGMKTLAAVASLYFPCVFSFRC